MVKRILAGSLIAQCALAPPALAQCDELLIEFASEAASPLTVDVSGTHVIAGAPSDAVGRGDVRFFTISGGSISPQPHSAAPSLDPGDGFGTGVAISGLFAVAGLPGFGRQIEESGALLVFSREGGNWIASELVLPPTPTHLGNFGSSVDLDGDLLVVGEPGSLGTSGKAHVYELTGGTFEFAATLTAPGGAVGDEFGAAVAADGIQRRVVVGAPGSDVLAPDAGAAFEFSESQLGAWTLEGGNGGNLVFISQPGSRQGSSVALNGQWRLLGAPGWDRFDAPDAGAVLVTRKQPGVVSFGFVSEGTQPDERRGTRLSSDGVVVGIAAPGFASISGPTGAAVLGQLFPQFVDGVGTTVAIPFVPNSPAGVSLFGQDVAVDAGRLVVLSGRRLFAYDATDFAWQWRDLGNSLGPPRLRGEGALCGADQLRLELTGFTASEALLVAGSVIQLQLFHGGVLVPQPQVILSIPLDGDGSAEIEARWPVGLPATSALVVQAWAIEVQAPTGFVASNALIASGAFDVF